MMRYLCFLFMFLLWAGPCAARVSGWTAFGNARLAGDCAVLENGEAGSRAGIEYSVPVADGYIRAYRLRGLFEASAEDKGDLWLYCDVYYRDGTHTWGPWVPIDKKGVCRRRLDIIPTRPVRSIYCLVIFRNSRGRAVVKDVSLAPL
ncbi:MAG: hypothetical protein IJT95_02475, partial [Abditibacteriota bacterium]|nr:hypothetical protein [Abditibacteriota bacterium]